MEGTCGAFKLQLHHLNSRFLHGTLHGFGIADTVGFSIEASMIMSLLPDHTMTHILDFHFSPQTGERASDCIGQKSNTLSTASNTTDHS